MNWEYFVLGIIVFQILKALWLGANRAVIEHRKKRFLKLVAVTFPDKETVTFISLDTSDKRSMKRLEDQLREKYGLPKEQPRKIRNHGGGYRS